MTSLSKPQFSCIIRQLHASLENHEFVEPWTRPICTFDNSKSYYMCSVCGHELKTYSIKKYDTIVRCEHKTSFTNVFGKKKIILPVVHVIETSEDVFDQINFDENLSRCFSANVDGVFLVNNDCSSFSLINAYIYAKNKYPLKWIGLNYLGNCYEAIHFAKYLNVDGLWLDNIGVFDEDVNRAEFIQSYIQFIKLKALIFGGICFKYQRQPENPTLTASNASKFTDVITTSGNGTSHPIEIEKLQKIYDGVSNTNFIAVASGISCDNVRDILPYVDVFMMHTSVVDSDNLFDVNKLLYIKNIIN